MSKRSASSLSSSVPQHPSKKIRPGNVLGGSISSAHSTKESFVPKFKQWTTQNKFKGAQHLDYDISSVCGNTLGCFARRSFKENDLLFSAPSNCMIGIDKAALCPVVNSVHADLKQLGLLDKVTVEFFFWLHMVEAKREGTHSVYLQSLADVPPSLLCWPQTLRGFLQDTNVMSSVLQIETSLEQYAELLQRIRCSSDSKSKSLIPIDLFNLSALRWAAGHYLSRRYPGHFTSEAIPALFEGLSRCEGLGNLGSLVPLLDLLNHDQDREPLIFEVTETELQVRTRYPIGAGEELFSSYGQLSNGQMLFAFGYALPHNPHDEFLLKIKLPPALQQSQQNQGLFALRRGGFHGIPRPLFTALKAMIRLSEKAPTSNSADEAKGEEALVVDEDCLELLYSFLCERLHRLHGRYESMWRSELLEQYNVRFLVPYPGLDRDGELRAMMDLRPCIVEAMPLSRDHEDEDEQMQAYALSVAYYLAGQFDILLEVVKDLQGMFSAGEEDEEEGDNDDDDDDEDGDDDDEDEDEEA